MEAPKKQEKATLRKKKNKNIENKYIPTFKNCTETAMVVFDG